MSLHLLFGLLWYHFVLAAMHACFIYLLKAMEATIKHWTRGYFGYSGLELIPDTSHCGWVGGAGVQSVTCLRVHMAVFVLSLGPSVSGSSWACSFQLGALLVGVSVGRGAVELWCICSYLLSDGCFDDVDVGCFV